MRIEWQYIAIHARALIRSLVRAFNWFIAVRGANTCIRAWQIAAREPLMTRTNDQDREDGPPGRRRESGGCEKWEKKIKAGPERTRRTVRYGSPEEVDSSMKPIRKRNRFTAGCGRGEDGTKLKESFNRQKDKSKPFEIFLSSSETRCMK